MKIDTTMPDHFNDIKEEGSKREEDLKAAAKRRDAYSLIRDAQANENNEAIARRLERDKENPSSE
ncbi:MAG: hypothetical protein WAL29_13150 [Bacteroidales bacterium]